MGLTLVSYNMHSGIGTDGRFDLERVGEVLREIDADLIALQEVGDYRGVTPRNDHPEHLARQLGLHLAFGPNVERGGRRYGNAILSRLPILRSRNYDLSVGRSEPRGALRCDLDLGAGQQLHLFCLHLGLGILERRKQESLLLSSDILRDAVRSVPIVVCGDFNYWGPGAVRGLARQAIHDVALELKQRERTFPSRFPLLRLDRIYVDEGVVPVSLQTHRTPLSARASDHLPLVMRFETRLHPRLQESAPVQLIG